MLISLFESEPGARALVCGAASCARGNRLEKEEEGLRRTQ